MMSTDRLLHLSLAAKPQDAGHAPSFRYPQVPDGLALCIGCWQVTKAIQLGFERCSGRPEALQSVFDHLAPGAQQ